MTTLHMSNQIFAGFVCLLTGLIVTPVLPAAEIFVEAESFDEHGGWKLDTQFIQQMGSPYLLAHGIGKPVDDAKTSIDVSEAGRYRIWVRTIDWVARWDASPSPGKFQVLIGGQPLQETFGTRGKEWTWHDGGEVDLSAGQLEVGLHDLTGFDGRCDCIYMTTDLDAQPKETNEVLSPWRRQQLGLPEQTQTKDGYDLVVIGGGYAGMGSAISAARMGCRVALIQDRGVLGGNGSSEVRVWAMGNIRRGKFPRIGEIIEEFTDHATKSPGRYEEFGDELKEKVVRAEPNIDLMLDHHAYAVQMDDDFPETPGASRRIKSVSVVNTRTGEDLRVAGKMFSDCTGHGWIGEWADADHETEADGRMGMSNMWAWDEVKKATSFPETPWALDLKMEDFPYPRAHHGQWFWESGFDKDAIGEAEAIRDWNLRAVFGAFNAMKNGDGASKHTSAILTWVAYVGGPRESRRLMGDVVLTQDDVVTKREFPDGCVPSTWSIDLHYPKEQYAKKFPDNPFISKAVHDNRVDRSYGYPVPYRCFYSRNVDNLFMAGRNISVTHAALGTVRVMKTCGMMGEVVGKATSICVANQCDPRSVYERYLPELLELLELPGKARRESLTSPIDVPDDAMRRASAHGPISGLDTDKLPGIVIDDTAATLSGKWNKGSGLKPFVMHSYRYASDGSGAKATFKTTVEKSGQYELHIYTLPHENRGTSVPVQVKIGDADASVLFIDQQRKYANDRVVKGPFDIQAGQVATVTVSTENAGGNVHADAIGWLLKK